MNYSVIAEWLTQNVFGIIILGAIGSGVFVAAKALIQSAVQKLLSANSTFNNWKRNRARNLGKSLGHFYKSNNHAGGISIIIYKAYVGILCTVVSFLSAILFGFLLLAGQETLTWGSYFFLVMSMVTGFKAYTEYRELRLIHGFFWERSIQEESSTDEES